jgi:hypothetical protein
MLFDEDLLKRIDDFRFAHRFHSRTAAVRWLVLWALNQAPKPAEQDERK